MKNITKIISNNFNHFHIIFSRNYLNKERIFLLSLYFLYFQLSCIIQGTCYQFDNKHFEFLYILKSRTIPEKFDNEKTVSSRYYLDSNMKLKNVARKPRKIRRYFAYTFRLNLRSKNHGAGSLERFQSRVTRSRIAEGKKVGRDEKSSRAVLPPDTVMCSLVWTYAASQALKDCKVESCWKYEILP